VTEYQLTVPTGVGYKIADELFHLCQAAGGSTLVVGVGSWLHPETGERINENVGQHTFIVDDYSPRINLNFVDLLNATARALHREGEHTVLIRRLSGRGIVHFFLTKGMEVPYL
jgi:hypothetical protein